MTNLFKFGSFTLSSGLVSNWKIECDALTDDDWETLAAIIALKVGNFSYVYGVPTGGWKLALKLRRFETTNFEHPFLIVDDVLTTGESIKKMMNGGNAIGYVVFARGPLPKNVRALFQMEK